jgi:hypothetical protein
MFSRFPEWGKLIGNALIFYGYPDPTRGGYAIREADPVKEAMRDVVPCQNLGRLGFIAVGQKAFSKFDRQSQDDNGIVGFLRQLACEHQGVSAVPRFNFHHTIPTPCQSRNGTCSSSPS